MSRSLWEKIKDAFGGGDAAPPASSRFFVMKIEDVFAIAGVGAVVTGRVQSGSVRADDAVIVRSAAGKERRCRVVDIEKVRRKLEAAAAGDNVGIILSGVKTGDIARGDTLTNA